jgi:dihydrofolate reductase
MRSVVLFIACSLDGSIARENGDIDWLFTDQDYGYTEFFKTVDTVLMGRRTYDQVLSFGEYPYKGTEGYVFSRKRGAGKDANVTFVSDDPVDFIRSLKQKAGKVLWLVGGSELIHPCVQHDLIDEYVISVHPVILGGGIPLFRSPLRETWLRLKRSKTFDSGLVQLTYVRKKI